MRIDVEPTIQYVCSFFDRNLFRSFSVSMMSVSTTPLKISNERVIGMKRILLLLLGLAFCSLLLVAQEKMQKQEKKEVKETKAAAPSWTGYLVDKMCGARYVKGDAASAAEKGMKHSKACALDEDCAASGFGIIMDGKYVKFDEAGDKMAADYLNKSDKKSNFLVEVSGSKDGDMLKVKSLADAKVEMKKEEPKKEESKKY